MKYVLFNKSQRELLTNANTMLERILNESKNELIRVTKEEGEIYAKANKFEAEHGVDDALTQSAWRRWTLAMEDKQALANRLNELEDAMRFNSRLLKNV